MIGAWYFAAALIGYLIGSIPFGVLVSKGVTGTDIRQVGSGKIGTTNVLRTAGRKAAIGVLLLDMAKGALPVIFTGLIFGSHRLVGDGASVAWMMKSAQVLSAIAAIIGHNWSVFLKFKGGRGVATFLGGLFALYWPAAVLAGIIMIAVGAISKYMSLGSITGAVAAFVMLITLFILQPDSVEYLFYTFYTMLCSPFIFLRHHDNVARLISGTERRLGEKVEANNSHSAK